ncbi:MAG: DNA-protecting protein DprA [Alphaproteobacteria bacterium]|nr:DNA-protecting protein DprA [Alphaproteobacteria bacterium]
MRVDGFWSGAAQVARRVPLNGRVRESGGWRAVLEGGSGALGRLGLPGPLVERWRRAGPIVTQGRALTLADADYPAALAALPDAPPVLFVEGEVGALQARALAVVGTRTASLYGRQVARDLGARAARAGWVVVSGLARGVDGEAHSGAASAGRTVAVLAHGLAHTSPPSHVGLRRRILSAGGAMVTTWPDAEPAQKWTFPNRNRWIAGLASAVVVVEAGVTSGALHTVRAAADYGREVFAVPGPIGAVGSEGCNRLLAEGATPVVGIGELLAQLGSPEDARTWVDRVVSGEPLVGIARERGLGVAEVLAELAMMEAVGELVRLPGNRFARAR